MYLISVRLIIHIIYCEIKLLQKINIHVIIPDFAEFNKYTFINIT
jgi:hypothetical protein